MVVVVPGLWHKETRGVLLVVLVVLVAVAVDVSMVVVAMSECKRGNNCSVANHRRGRAPWEVPFRLVVVIRIVLVGIRPPYALDDATVQVQRCCWDCDCGCRSIPPHHKRTVAIGSDYRCTADDEQRPSRIPRRAAAWSRWVEVVMFVVVVLARGPCWGHSRPGVNWGIFSWLLLAFFGLLCG